MKLPDENRLVEVFKYHCYGNDFLIHFMEHSEVPANRLSDFSRAICDPHFGIGADGCVFLRAGANESFDFRVFNQDGSEAGLSGNGARCACACLHHLGRTKQDLVALNTPSGFVSYQLLAQDDAWWDYRSDMGEPVFVPERIPVKPAEALDSIEDYPLLVYGTRSVEINALWVGNPQCVVFVPELLRPEDFQSLGSTLEVHPIFPQRTNVSFVRVDNAHQLTVQIWERGVGPTHSSGTGSCGAAVAAIRTQRAASPVEVRSATGSQRVEWDLKKDSKQASESSDPEGTASKGSIFLTGRAEFIGKVHFLWKGTEVT